jgi:glucose/arabinose dehydrogenase
MSYSHLFVSLVALANAFAASAALAQDRGNARLIAAMTTADWSVQVATDDVSYPWTINQAGGVIVMTEAAGNIVMIDGGRLRRYALQTSDPIVNDGGSGLLGMALDENFQANGRAYLYHSYRSSGLTNKVIEARFDGDSWRETRVLLAGIPGHRLYNGGRIAIGPDRLLYVTTGWTENGALPQDLGLPRGMGDEVLEGLIGGRLADPLEHRRHRLARAVAQQPVDVLAQRHVLRAMTEAVLELIQPSRQAS